MAFDSGLYQRVNASTWPLVSATRCLAFAENVPLQIVTRSRIRSGSLEELLVQHAHRNNIPALKNKYQKEIRSLSYDLLSLPDDIDECFRYFAKRWDFLSFVYPIIHQKLFVTPPAHVSPFFHHLRNHRMWRWWEFKKIYQLMVEFSAPSNEQFRTFHFPPPFQKCAGICLTPIGKTDYFVLVGPSWIAPSGQISLDDNSLIDFDRISESLLESLRKGIRGIENVDNRLDKLGVVGPLISFRRLRRSAEARKAGSEIDLISRGKTVSSVLDSFLSSPLDRDSLSKGQISALIGLASFLSRNKSLMWTKENARTSITVHLRSSIVDGRAAFHLLQNSDGILFSSLNEWPYEKNERFRVESDKPTDSLQEQLSGFLQNKHSTKNLWYRESFELLLEWLNDQDGGWFTVSDSQYGDMDVAIRIARSLCYVMNSDEACIYECDYSAPKRILRGFVAFSAASDGISRRRIMKKHMEDIGTEPALAEERGESISYRALDDHGPQLVRNFSPDLGIAIGGKMTYPKQQAKINWGRSAIAIPLRFFDREWGVLELINLRPEGFDDFDLSAISSLSNPLARFYYARNLILNISRLIDEISDPARTLADKYKLMNRRLMNILLCDNTAIFVRSSAEPGRYILRGRINRPDLFPENLDLSGDAAVESISFDADDDYKGTFAIASQHVRPNKPLIMASVTEVRGFNANPIRRPNGQDQQQYDIPLTKKLLVTCRIQGGEEQYADGLITFFLPPGSELDQRWNGIFKYVSAIYRIFLKIVERMHDESWDNQNVLAHELRQMIRLANSTIREAREGLRSSARDDDYRVIALRKADFIDEITDSALDLLDRYTDTFGQKSTPLDEILLLTYKRLVERDRDANTGRLKCLPLDIRKTFNETFQRRSAQLHASSIELEWATEYSYPDVHIHEISLRAVFSNLADNAIKYSLPSSLVLAEIKEFGNDIYFSVKNLGRTMTEHEKTHAFDKNFRGDWAVESSIKGSGFGLWFSRRVLRLYGCEIEYYITPAAGTGNAWHEFQVFFPKALLTKTKA
jgi:signal transduction histidine kinase